MYKIAIILGLVACTFASRIGYGDVKEQKGSVREFLNANPAPGILFERAYFVDDGEGGSQFRRGARLENGKVQGAYGVNSADGNSRVVYYEADENGARYWIETNEPGTSDANTGDAEYRPLSGNKEVYDESTNLAELIARISGAEVAPKAEATEPEKEVKTVYVRPNYYY